MSADTLSTVEFSEIKKKINQALNDFRENDLNLLELTVDERATTHRIAVYIERYFTGWDVDCEYNRREKNIKSVSGIGNVRPDIIVHKRGLSENLLVIEVKKADNTLLKDKAKLIEFTKIDGDYHYQFGLLILLSMIKPYILNGEWYQRGLHMKEEDICECLGD